MTAFTMERQVTSLFSRVFTLDSISFKTAAVEAFELAELAELAERGGSTLSPLLIPVLADRGFTGVGSTCIWV